MYRPTVARTARGSIPSGLFPSVGSLQYYNAKQFKEDSPEEAFEWFEKVVAAETPAAEWSFKATKQMVKLHLRQGNFAKMMEQYHVVLERTKVRWCMRVAPCPSRLSLSSPHPNCTLTVPRRSIRTHARTHALGGHAVVE
jgi:hypothetical protein